MIERVKDGIVRMNELVLTFPVWLVLGLTGLLRSREQGVGWSGPEDVGDPAKLY